MSIFWKWVFTEKAKFKAALLEVLYLQGNWKETLCTFVYHIGLECLQSEAWTDDDAGFELLTLQRTFMIFLVKKLQLFNQLEPVDLRHLVLTENEVSCRSLIVWFHDCLEEVDCFLRGSIVFNSTVEVKLVDELFEVDETFCFFVNKDN